MFLRLAAFIFLMSLSAFSQAPPIEPGVSHTLAKWRAARYSDVRYKLNLTLEKMSPVLKGTMEIRVKVSEPPASAGVTSTQAETRPVGSVPQIVLDWRKIKGFEDRSTISNVSINGFGLYVPPPRGFIPDRPTPFYEEANEHLIFREGVVAGENVIKLDFTSPILTTGSAITRYVDKEDGAEYIYSLFVPSDASTAFPVFDQPDLKARFTLSVSMPKSWRSIVSNSAFNSIITTDGMCGLPLHNPRTSLLLRPNDNKQKVSPTPTPKASPAATKPAPVEVPCELSDIWGSEETKPISTYVFAFAAGPWERVGSPHVSKGSTRPNDNVEPCLTVGLPTPDTSIYVRKSQAEKFKPHAAEVFRLNREGVKFLEGYFDYKFPFSKYDLVLIPEFPFGGMEHAGATFLRESSVIFPQEPTKNDYISRANVIFHEAAHQWFGDTVTMRWFDDLWLKEGFAEFMAYKTLEKVMPEYNAWKVFYERNKQAAYLTDSTKGTTPIYQEIANLNAAKSAYGNIVYRKAPSFLKQAEFYIGPDKFQTAVRAFLKKHEFANAGWEDLVKEFEATSGRDLTTWADSWVKQKGLFKIRISSGRSGHPLINKGSFIGGLSEEHTSGSRVYQERKLQVMSIYANGTKEIVDFIPYTNVKISASQTTSEDQLLAFKQEPILIFPNYQDYGYGIFLLDDKSRDYVLKNIQNEKDDFLRTMMWGSLWDSVREGELDPRVFVELVIKNLSSSVYKSTTPSAEAAATPPKTGGEQDESTIQTLLGRVSTAMTYYLSEPPAVAGGLTRQTANEGEKAGSAGNIQPSATAGGSDKTADLRVRVENLLIERMQNAPTLGQRITFYRAFLNIASTENARGVLKKLLTTGGNLSGSEGVPKAANSQDKNTLPTGRVSASGGESVWAGSPRSDGIPLKTKDRFDIVTKLLILGDPDAPKLLAELEKTETSDEAKRYAYAAKAGIATAENKVKYWNDFTTNKEISESWIEAAFGPFNSVRHADLALPYLERALRELPNLKRNRKIFFVNGWLSAFISGQRSEGALVIVNKFLANNPDLDKDLRLKILENVDVIERAVNIRAKSRKRTR